MNRDCELAHVVRNTVNIRRLPAEFADLLYDDICSDTPTHHSIMRATSCYHKILVTRWMHTRSPRTRHVHSGMGTYMLRHTPLRQIMIHAASYYVTHRQVTTLNYPAVQQILLYFALQIWKWRDVKALVLGYLVFHLNYDVSKTLRCAMSILSPISEN